MKTRTTKRKIVEHSQFKQMLSYRICYKDKSEQQQIKNQLKDEVVTAYGDKWIRLAEGTRSAIDEMVFMATERGFSFMSKDYLTRHGISKRTLDRVFNFLSDKRLIHIVYRRKGCLNLTGKPIFLFKNHPYFKYWIDFLSLDVANDDVANVAAENSQDTTLSSDLEDIHVSTNLLPGDHKELEKDRSKDDPIIDTAKMIPEYIPKAFSKLYQAYFGVEVESINELWIIAHRQFWKVNIEEYHYTDAACDSLSQLVGQMKIGRKIKNKLAYWTTICKATAKRIFDQELENMGFWDHAPEGELSFSMPHN
ncbi:hypothetical protein NIE88_12605 [Sporolactobacillus shoreicorticis]|uniref:Transcriptional regulator n=1 Tax=Sporolactobacillus shoreicorticis TaxID=1923877 RepID=A0ABW5S9G6_9BACL|nr:hypothetical protein [Sporolactobacillus shoreicorticis]MCO7126605.1 hypothetical protein [Sporolactobacillus shoreicorticis]